MEGESLRSRCGMGYSVLVKAGSPTKRNRLCVTPGCTGRGEAQRGGRLRFHVGCDVPPNEIYWILFLDKVVNTPTIFHAWVSDQDIVMVVDDFGTVSAYHGIE